MKKTILNSRIIVAAMMVAVLAVFASCSVYRPQAVQAPLIHEKGELQVNGSVGMSTLFIDMDPYIGVTAAFGATDWLAVQGHVNWNGGQGVYLQAAPGAYKAWGKAVLEGYVGYGFGSTYRNSSSDGRDHIVDAKYHIPFAQLNFGWAGLAKGHIDIGLAVKGGGMFPNVYEKNEREGQDPDIKTSRDPIALLEPQVFFRAGGKHLKWSLDVGFCYLWGSGEKQQPFGNTGAYFLPLTVTTGITYDLNLFDRKK